MSTPEILDPAADRHRDGRTGAVISDEEYAESLRREREAEADAEG